MKRKVKIGLNRLKHLPGGRDFIKYSSNKLLHIWNKYANSTVVVHPSVIMLEITNVCNLHCLTCPREYSYGKNMDIGFMNLQNLKKIVDEVYPYVDAIGLTGLGEPLLYRDLINAVEYINSKSKGIIISISTNANVSNTSSIIEKLVNKISTIQISIDGTYNVYEQIRRNGNYELLIDNIRNISELTKNSSTYVMFNTVITKENYYQMSELVNLANELKINSLNFNLFNLVSTTGISIDYYNFFHTSEFMHEFIKATEIAQKSTNLEFTTWDHSSTNEFKKCPFPWDYFYITWNGYLVPCCAKPFPKELNFGNVFDSSLMDCLNSNEFKNFRQKWFENITPEFCQKCHYVDLKPVK